MYQRGIAIHITIALIARTLIAYCHLSVLSRGLYLVLDLLLRMACFVFPHLLNHRLRSSLIIVECVKYMFQPSAVAIIHSRTKIAAGSECAIYST